MPDKPGFQIGGRFYPFPSSFRLGDPVLVEELTGLDWEAFLERIPDEEDPDDQPLDPVALLGLIGVAVWQANPRWRRDRVVRYVQALPNEAVEAVGGGDDEDEEAGGDGPPAEPAGQPESASSASDSESGSDSPSEPSSPTSSGPQTSEQ